MTASLFLSENIYFNRQTLLDYCVSALELPTIPTELLPTILSEPFFRQGKEGPHTKEVPAGRSMLPMETPSGISKVTKKRLTGRKNKKKSRKKEQEVPKEEGMQSGNEIQKEKGSSWQGCL